jgi:hypothetical protein
MFVRCTINGSQNQWFANDLFSRMPKANGPSRRNADGAGWSTKRGPRASPEQVESPATTHLLESKRANPEQVESPATMHLLAPKEIERGG